MRNSTRALTFLVCFLLSGAGYSAEKNEPPALRKDVPPGVAAEDPDRERFLIGRDPLRSFEDDALRWIVEPEERAGMPAKRSDKMASHGAYSIEIPCSFPDATAVGKRTTIGVFRYMTVDVHVPDSAAGRIYCHFHLKDKDGLWYQTAPRRIFPGRWNTVDFDLRPESRVLEPVGHFGVVSESFLDVVSELGFGFYGDEKWRGVLHLDNLRAWELDKPETVTFTHVEANSYEVPKNGKFEVTCLLSRGFTNPFDPEKVRLDGVFTTPDGKEVTVPGFWYQDFQRRRSLSGERLTPVGRGCWKVRFAPRRPGRYLCKLRVVAGKAEATSEPVEFTAVESSSHGFARVSSDGKYFEFDDRTSFYPLGHNIRSPNDPRCAQVLGFPLPSDEGTFAYDRYFERMQAGGENFVEIWMCSWWLGIEWSHQWKGYWGLGRYNLHNAWKLDHVLDSARRHGLLVQLIIDNHGKYAAKGQCDEEWSKSPYSLFESVYGGFLERPEQFFVSDHAWKYYANKIRYIMARWSWDPTIFSFEIISELDLIGTTRKSRLGYSQSVHDWHKRSAELIHSLDPNDHLLTTHYSGDYKKIDKRMAAMPFIDYITGDGYRQGDSPFADLAIKTAQHNRQFGKPFLITEYGGGWNATDKAGLRADLHSGLWASFMTSAGATPLLWWFDFIDKEELYREYLAFSRFVAGEDRRGRDLRTHQLAVEGASLPLWALAYTSKDGGYAWVSVKYLLVKAPPSVSELPKVKGAALMVDGLSNRGFAVEVWDTHTGEIISLREMRSSEGKLRIALPPFRGDAAVKIRPTGK